jgi:hypothetical protein
VEIKLNPLDFSGLTAKRSSIEIPKIGSTAGPLEAKRKEE